MKSADPLAPQRNGVVNLDVKASGAKHLSKLIHSGNGVQVGPGWRLLQQVGAAPCGTRIALAVVRRRPRREVLVPYLFSWVFARWDAADAEAEGWTWENIIAWARPRAARGPGAGSVRRIVDFSDACPQVTLTISPASKSVRHHHPRCFSASCSC